MVQCGWGALSDCLLRGEVRCGLLLVAVLCVIVVEGFGVVTHCWVVVEAGFLLVAMMYWFLFKDELLMEVYCLVGEWDVMCICEFVVVMRVVLLYDLGDVIVELLVDELVEYCMVLMVFYSFWFESVWWPELSVVECVWSDAYFDVFIEIFVVVGVFDLVLVVCLLMVVIDGLLLLVFLCGGDGVIDELWLLFGWFVRGLVVV